MDEFYDLNQSRFRKGKIEVVAAGYSSPVLVVNGTC